MESTENRIQITRIGHRALFIVKPDLIPIDSRKQGQSRFYGFGIQSQSVIGPSCRIPLLIEGREEKLEGIISSTNLMGVDDIGAIVEGNFTEEYSTIENWDELAKRLELEIKNGYRNLERELRPILTGNLIDEEPIEIGNSVIPIFLLFIQIENFESVSFPTSIKEFSVNDRDFKVIPMKDVIDVKQPVSSIKHHERESLGTMKLGLPSKQLRFFEEFTSLTIVSSTIKSLNELKGLFGAAECLLLLRLSQIVSEVLYHSVVEYEKMVDDIPYEKALSSKERENQLDKLREIHEKTTFFRRVQLLIDKWEDRYSHHISDQSQKAHPYLILFDELEKLDMEYIRETKTYLDERLSSLESAVQTNLDIGTAQTQLALDRRFGFISIMLGLFVIIEILGNFISWIFQGPALLGGELLWYTLITFVIIGSVYVIYNSIR